MSRDASYLGWHLRESMLSVLAVLVICVQSVHAQEEEKSVETLIEEIKSLNVIQTGPLTAKSPPEDMHMSREQARIKMYLLARQIGARGPSVIREVYDFLHDPLTDNNVRNTIISGLSEAEGVQVDQFLLDMALTMPETYATATSVLSNRSREKGGVQVIPTEAQMQHFISIVETGSRADAIRTGKLLSVFHKAPLAPRLAPYIRRFIQLCQIPRDPEFGTAYLGIDIALNVFRHFGSPVQCLLHETY